MRAVTAILEVSSFSRSRSVHWQSFLRCREGRIWTTFVLADLFSNEGERQEAFLSGKGSRLVRRRGWGGGGGGRRSNVVGACGVGVFVFSNDDHNGGSYFIGVRGHNVWGFERACGCACAGLCGGVCFSVCFCVCVCVSQWKETARRVGSTTKMILDELLWWTDDVEKINVNISMRKDLSCQLITSKLPNVVKRRKNKLPKLTNSIPGNYLGGGYEKQGGVENNLHQQLFLLLLVQIFFNAPLKNKATREENAPDISHVYLWLYSLWSSTHLFSKVCTYKWVQL